MSTPSYTPHLIAKYATGFDNSVQPWLLPDDAQQSLLDGFVYRGVWFKRPGYNQFAIGGKGGAPYCESRIVHRLSGVAMTGAINSSNRTYTLTATAPVRRGTFTVTGNTPAQSVTDDGLGAFTGNGTGTINYTTGAVSITFTSAPTGGTVLATYDYMPGNPVMMVANFYTATNTRQLVVADTRYVNRYNSTTNRLDDISPAGAYTGNNQNFFSWVNYEPAAGTPRLLFSNNRDVIQSYDGTTVTPYVYTMGAITTLTCLLMFQMKDRLLLLRTTEDGTTYGKRIRISGTGASSDVFDTTATGAGVIDIPDASWIQGAAFNRDDLIIFTDNSTWILKYTGNDVTPFTLDKLDESRGSGAPFAAITYLNRTSAVSPRGFTITDGYRVERMDDKIPEYSYNSIDQENFPLCFAGSVDEDRDHYLIHPSPQQSSSDRILVTNYEEDNFSVYRLPLSCMGNFIESYDVTWTDLLAYENWDQMAAVYGTWNDFSYTKGLPFAIGGGQKGEIWRLNVNGIEDNPVKIRAMTVIDANTLEIETDFNNFAVGDYIFINGITGMAEANDKQGAIKSIITANRVFRIDIPTTRFSAYTSGGMASRVIPFESLTKKFNPYAQNAQKVRCGWMYFYVSASDTGLTRNVNISAITQATQAQVTASNHQFKNGQLVKIFGVSGMTQINGLESQVTVIDENTFTMNAIDSSAFTAYTSGGVAAGPEECFIDVDVITNDILDTTQVQDASLVTIRKPYRVNCTPDARDDGSKRWYKIFINQTARFIQFKVSNTQALSVIQIQAMMPGFMGVGRLI